ncbi:MAG TPA: cell division protein FtsX [Gammaproteobacteria bacterium]|nr:cell division protein FtsX [Gammaproteobacteria bacterium]
MKPRRHRNRGPGFRRDRNPLTWLLRHAQNALAALGRLARQPLATLMTAGVIGIAIALPSGLHLLIDNVRTLTGGWDGGSSISLFLVEDLDDRQAEKVRARIAQRPDVAEARLISREQALQEFRRRSGFGEALDLLDHNPLPAVVLVRPAPDAASAEATGRLAKELEGFREIDMVRVDLQWVRRLEAITRTLERGIYLLAGLLSAAVLLIIGNTVRLEIQNRHSEIEVIKLVGGTDAFIRRPFLYEGLWYGLLGALIAIALVVGGLALMQGPVQRLAGLYQSDFSLDILTSGTLLAVLLGGPLLGLAGAWLAVNRHLARIQPE